MEKEKSADYLLHEYQKEFEEEKHNYLRLKKEDDKANMVELVQKMIGIVKREKLAFEKNRSKLLFDMLINDEGMFFSFILLLISVLYFFISIVSFFYIGLTAWNDYSSFIISFTLTLGCLLLFIFVKKRRKKALTNKGFKRYTKRLEKIESMLERYYLTIHETSLKSDKVFLHRLISLTLVDYGDDYVEFYKLLKLYLNKDEIDLLEDIYYLY